jgi:hypothetical protein
VQNILVRRSSKKEPLSHVYNEKPIARTLWSDLSTARGLRAGGGRVRCLQIDSWAGSGVSPLHRRVGAT